MASRPSIGLPKLSRRSRILLTIAAVIVVLLIVGARLIDTYVDWLWFGEVGFQSVFTTELLTRIGLFFAVGVFVGGLLAVSLTIAYRTRPVFVPVSGAEDPLARYRSTIVQRVRLFGIGLPVVTGIVAGWAAQGDWQRVQLLFNAVPFGKVDPEFGIDIGFYAFKLPFYEWLISWFYVALVVAFIGAVITHYIFGGIRLAGRGGQLSGPARVHLSTVAGLFVLVYAVDYFFDRYELLYSSRNDTFTGATYTDLNAVMPAKLILMSIAIFCAIAFFVGAFLRNLQLPAIALVLLVLSGLLVGVAWPAVLDQFSVKPNANEKEAKSIERNLVATKEAFGLTDDKVKIEDYPKTGAAEPSSAEIRNDKGTIPNVRLLDPGILAPTFTQREARANFYGFPDKLDVDRYEVNGKVQDYVVAVREIKTSGLTEQQNSWINRHMVYTHGNGFVAAPANTIDRAPSPVGATGANASQQGGYPQFTVSDLNALDKKEKMDIPVTEPRIYYGELATTYAIVGGKAGEAPGEYDPVGESKYLYKGKGGVPIDGLFNRLVFAAYEGERNILFNTGIGEGSKIMYNRDPRERVKKAAPWLTVDTDPYPAVIDGRIQWIVDGYTTLDNYPYSQSTSLGQVTTDSLAGVPRQQDKKIGYIRNSVKATVDAYDGSVTLYGIDESDPVLKAWSGVFPGTVKPAKDVPKSLKQHFRYPEDLFKVQRDLLARYHVTTPQDYFSQLSFWDVPSDPTKEGSDSGAAAKQPPYYVLAQAPGQGKPTFQVTSALTALRQQFLAAWVSVSSEPEDYGQFKVLRLPTQGNPTPGPNQVQNQMRTTDKFTQERTLFQNTGVDVRYGNLLTLPVGGGLIYVEPIYLQQKDVNAFPQLARVLVAYKNRVGFAATLSDALDQVFGPGSGSSTTQPGQTTDPTKPPASTPPTSSNTPAPPNTGGASPELNAAINDITTALAKLKTAQQGGGLAEIGKAIEELDAATKKYDQAKAASTQQPPPQTSNPPSSPTPPGGG
ncbi:UPF0182 family protein [Kibdelosporangium phytohabitans]|uniref:UPF0182 protein AOZ06_08100 n=1 Tax=Kibdelosporangium phytohabitans TaxID=860235 RepID=A0A0N9HXR8_9PSEU|nr:UPF0182 family protein [Kibdelosporangium phytohabitans]ALG06896.1 hypothetical protein AOZ06_08100 [Kibdelosporangium phytohabitans]MBE1468154.1 uncharacterized membrane protein (UPF0182 family) [Kibdelosporangium phytohabitans]